MHLACGYATEGQGVTPLAAGIGSDIILPCDVTDEASIDAVFETLEARWGKIDFVVHAIAYSDKEELKGKYVSTSAENFAQTMMVSCYSFTAICRRAEALMPDGGSLITLSYAGSERVMPHYGLMGVAKAAPPPKEQEGEAAGDASEADNLGATLDTSA